MPKPFYVKMRTAKKIFKLYSVLGKKKAFTNQDMVMVLGERVGNLYALRANGIIVNITPVWENNKRARSDTKWRFTDQFREYAESPEGQEEIKWAIGRR